MIHVPVGATHLLEQWFQKARQGSDEAIGKLFETCRRYLLRKAKQLIPPDLQGKKAPSDLVQESFLTAHRNIGQFQGTSLEEYLAWLEKILRHHFEHLCREFRVFSKRQVQREIPLHTPQPGHPEAVGEQLVSSAPSPSEAAIRSEQAQAIRKASSQLPPEYQHVLRLHFWSRYSFKEIAKYLGCSEEAARSKFRRALTRLSKLSANFPT